MVSFRDFGLLPTFGNLVKLFALGLHSPLVYFSVGTTMCKIPVGNTSCLYTGLTATPV